MILLFLFLIPNNEDTRTYGCFIKSVFAWIIPRLVMCVGLAHRSFRHSMFFDLVGFSLCLNHKGSLVLTSLKTLCVSGKVFALPSLLKGRSSSGRTWDWELLCFSTLKIPLNYLLASGFSSWRSHLKAVAPLEAIRLFRGFVFRFSVCCPSFSVSLWSFLVWTSFYFSCLTFIASLESLNCLSSIVIFMTLSFPITKCGKCLHQFRV